MKTQYQSLPFGSKILLFSVFFMLNGCTSLLPSDSKVTKTLWTSYEQAELEFATIHPGKTTLKQLKAMGLDPATTSNIALLSHTDLLRRLEAVAAFEGVALDPPIKLCVAAQQRCYAYHLEQTYLKHERVGNFWLDILNFKQVTDITGWKFDALIIVSDDLVIYKTWSGKPNIHEVEQERHPLGPLQGIGGSLIHY